MRDQEFSIDNDLTDVGKQLVYAGKYAGENVRVRYLFPTSPFFYKALKNKVLSGVRGKKSNKR